MEDILCRNSLSSSPTYSLKHANFGRNTAKYHGSRSWKAGSIELNRFQNVRCGPPKRSPPSSKSSQAWGQESEEEIFSLSKGWKINPLTLAPEENLSDVGIIVPPKMKPKTKKEKIPGAQVQSAAEEQKERLIHRKLKIIAGNQGGRKLLSPADAAVRPMMEVVRGAVFSMIQGISGRFFELENRKWLDLYSGTGSVGIEALSRGCTTAHFVELDPWVIENVLGPNLRSCSFTENSIVHNSRVETFLEKAQAKAGSHNLDPFDYISVTPPYELVVYTDLMRQLSESPLIHSETCMLVEYPLRSKSEIPDRCGPLFKVRDRKYGRTNVAIYGPEWAIDDDKL